MWFEKLLGFAALVVGFVLEFLLGEALFRGGVRHVCGFEVCADARMRGLRSRRKTACVTFIARQV